MSRMSIASIRSPALKPEEQLHNGDRMLREEFHRLYEKTPDEFNAKLQDYRRYGVLEYLVVNLADRRLHWLDLRTGTELTPDADGVVRVRCFPGLWIHVEALLAKDYNRLMTTLQQGLATPEHAAFVRRLEDARKARAQATL